MTGCGRRSSYFRFLFAYWDCAPRFPGLSSARMAGGRRCCGFFLFRVLGPL